MATHRDPLKTRQAIPVITPAHLGIAKLRASIEAAQYTQEEVLSWLRAKGEQQLASELAAYLGCAVAS